ncbi:MULTISPECIES: hypothetical protein [unclassified Micromonospora]|uniref:hypothetical protein n=1 Tax=unclassified Micromonospora TaxID=2617518 RepID=UPI001C211FCA|nr:MULTISPECIES: hypothetical protein [unclassified Micromonospora]MBU8857789.1 hypothetical protein [Micromonospora sp. WMMB482]MDM4783419.1 hypothetical protein [Micromonospora sp. b486]
MDVLLRGGPGDGQVVPATGDVALWKACLYDITGDYGHRRRGPSLRIYQHRPDCCEPHGRGSDDRCE